MIKKRGNSWWVVVYTGRDPLTGKKRQKTGTARTRAEARQLEARLIREAGTGQHRAAGNKTVAELLDAWSEWRPRKGEISERTMLGYRSQIEHKIIPALGELRLSRIESPGVARILDVANTGSGGLIVSEWIRGGSLQEVAETSPSPIGAARAMQTLAAAAEQAHRAGVSLSIDRNGTE